MQRNPTKSFQDRTSVQSRPALLLMAAALGLSPAMAAAQDAEYGDGGPITHEFTIETRGSAAPRLMFTSYVFATARCDSPMDIQPARGDRTAQQDVGLAGAVRSATAMAGGTVSNANASITVTDLDVGTAEGEYSVWGDVTLCAPPAPEHSARGKAKSWAMLSYVGQTSTPSGRIKQVGRWKNTPKISGGASTGRTGPRGPRPVQRAKDPVTLRVTNTDTGEVIYERTVLTVDNFVQGGSFEWDNDRVTNTSPTMEFGVVYDDGISRPYRLSIKTEFGIVTESIATGAFSGVAVPPVGSPADFQFDLENAIEITFDIPADPDHTYDIEVEMWAAGEAEATRVNEAGFVFYDLYVHDDIGTALDGGDPVLVGQHFWTPSEYGIPLETDRSRALVPVMLLGDEPGRLEEAVVRVVDFGGEPFDPVGAMFHVRLWPGHTEWPAIPGAAAVPIGGDVMTDVSGETTFAEAYAVHEDDLLDPTAPLKDVTLDLSALPIIEPGELYWLEVTATPSDGAEVFLPLSPYHPGDGSAPLETPSYVAFEGFETMPLRNPDSGRMFGLPIQIFGDTRLGGGCRVDLDGDGELSIFDFLVFQNLFVAGDLAADFDGDGELTVFDFLAFQNEFVTGCPG